MKTAWFIALLLAGSVQLNAETRSSATYGVTTEITATSGGGRTVSSSTLYSHDGSLGGVVGISTVASPSQAVKHGYVGQLYDPAGLAVMADATVIDETQSTQLGASLTMDDDTMLPLAPTDVAWSVMAGPFTGITAGGVAVSGQVYEDTLGTLSGSAGGLEDTVGVTVRNVGVDDFGSYAGDGLDDDWQVGYFGIDNPLAAPGQNPDFDPHDNRFEFLAMLDPTDPASRFHLEVEPVPGQPTHKNVKFWPRHEGQNYNVMWSGTLGAGANWMPLSGGIVSDNGTERTVTDTAAGGDAKFYQVEIGGDPPGPGTDVVLYLSGTPGSGTIQYVLSGTATLTSSSTQAAAFSMGGFGNYTNVFENPDVGPGDAMVTNTTTSESQPMSRFGIRDLGSSDELQIVLTAGVIILGGQSLEFSGSGTFELGAGETFDQLVPGTHVGAFTLPSNLDGTVGIVIAPAP